MGYRRQWLVALRERRMRHGIWRRVAQWKVLIQRQAKFLLTAKGHPPRACLSVTFVYYTPAHIHLELLAVVNHASDCSADANLQLLYVSVYILTLEY